MRKLSARGLWLCTIVIAVVIGALTMLRLSSDDEQANKSAPSAEPDVSSPLALPEEASSALVDDGHVIILSHVALPGSIKDACAHVLQRQVAALSHDSWRVEIMPNSEAYRDGDEIGGLQAGGADMLVVSLPKLAEIGATDFQVYALPFLFQNDAEFRKIAEGPIGQGISRSLESKGVTLLAYWSHGFQGFSAKRPIHKPSDLEGLTIRVQHSVVAPAYLEKAGAQTRVSTFAGQRALMEKGEVSGAEITPANLVSLELDVFQPHFTVTNHGLMAYAVVVRSAWWANLPSELRELLQVALAEATRESKRLAELGSAAALSQLEARGHTQIYQPTPSELDGWRRAFAPVSREASNGVSAQTLRAVREAFPGRLP